MTQDTSQPAEGPVDEIATDEIAIVGMACRLPGAPDIDRFWANLCAGVESITRFSPAELAALGVPAELIAHPGFVPAGAQVDDVEAFDYRFWGYSPREAALLDPQQRLFLETAWTALENAGYSSATYDGMIGVYAGMGLSTYLLYTLLGNPAVTEADAQLAMLGNDKDFLASRVSYHLDLRGPSLTVQTGCSTSLVATHLACDGLLSYQCDIALVGGASVVLPERTGYVHFPGSTASSDGHCRAFDARGDGTVFGSGAGVIVLKRLEDALDAGDTIYAVIKGSAVNSDGANRVGFTAPSVEGQAEVVHRAQLLAQVDPATIGYVEAHGTGTELGDPVEIAALTKVFRQRTEATGFCAIGSVKTNIGHLDTAAGVAGLIKTALAVHHGRIPPSLNFTEANPRLELATSPFFVNDSLTDWPSGPTPRRAGVSAFGFGGTNAHVVLEQAPQVDRPAGQDEPQVLVLSAKTDSALATATERLADHLDAHPEQDLADVAFTLQRGRTPFEYRKAVVCQDRVDAITALRSGEAFRVHERRTERFGGQVAFLFAGLGDQYPGMGRDLYQRLPVFRDAVNECCDLLVPHLGLDLRTLLYPNDGSAPAGGLDLRAMLGAAPDDPLQRTALAHPALFVVEYALARQWMAWGIRPSTMIGHSLGEYVAATLAEVFPLADVLRIVAGRAALYEQAPEGAMLAVSLDPGRTSELLPDGCSVALMNGPRLTAVSGPVAAVEELERRLAEAGIVARRMRARQGFHSSMVASVMLPLAAMFDGVTLSEPRIPFVSNVTGDWITPAQATDPNYWAEHSVRPVEFARGLATLCAKGEPALVEIGPGQSLSALAAEHLAESKQSAQPVVLPSLRASYDRRHQNDEVHLLDVLGQLWAAGVDVKWPALHGGTRRRVALPSYPFERQRCRLDPVPVTPRPRQPEGRLADSDSWFLAPSWRSLPMPRPVAADHWKPGEHWLVCTDDNGIGNEVAELAVAAGQRVTVVERGDRFVTTDSGYRIDPADAESYSALIDALAADRRPTRVIHLWSLDNGDERTLGMHSLMWLAKALAPGAAESPVDVWVVTRGVAVVERSDVARPRTATLLGAAKCAPQEYEGISVHCVDVQGADPGVAGRLLDAIAEAPAERLLAYRGARRWVQTFEPIDLGAARTRLRPGGVYVITGGLGEIGLELAGHLVAQADCRVVLIGRTQREDARLTALRERGSVFTFAADVADEKRMREVFDDVQQRIGPVNGVFHAAGLVGEHAFAAIEQLDPRSIDEIVRAKVTGTEVLADVVRGQDLDFVLLVSSNAAVLGGLGTSAYTAGCVFLDTFAQSAAQSTVDKLGTRWISLDLEDWLPDDGLGRPITSVTRYGITPHDGVRALVRVAQSAPAGLVTLVTGDLEERLDRWIRHPEVARRGRVAPGGARTPRPALATEYESPRDDIEAAVAEIWSELLGIDKVGRDDDFYQLGGHSLLATQIVARVRARYGGELSLLNLLRSPTVAGLTAAVRDGTGANEAPAAIAVVSREEPVPLSYGQRRFWIIDQLAPGLAAYNVPDVARIEGPLRADVLHASVNDIVARHEALRTCLRMSADTGGEPVQVIADSIDVELDTVDLRAVPAEQRTDRWRELANAEAHRPFDLSQPPLVRTTLIRLADEAHILLLTMHHSVSDAWSTGVFINELAAHYAARCAGGKAVLEPLPVQYADYAVWQRTTLEGAQRERLLDHWRDALAGAPRLIEFPVDRARPLTQSFTGASVPLTLPADLVDALRRFGGTESATLFMTLLTAFNCLLHRYSGERDLVVGSPIAGRTRPELEPLIGAFTNMLALRTTIEPGWTLREVLRKVRDSTLGAYAHQELPFELVVEALRPERTLGYSQIFQNVLVLQNAPLPPLELAGLRIEQVPMPSTTAKFDLMIMLRETGDGAIGMIEYRTDLFTEDTISQIGRHFTAILHSMAAQPDRPLSELDLLSSSETTLVTERWAYGTALPAAPESIPDMITARAAATPDGRAIVSTVDSQSDVTFGELETWSNQLAHTLREHGVRPESRVGVCAGRSPMTVVLLLAIMKVGAAYLPLDPAYPVERLRFMVDDARADLVVVEGASRERLGETGTRTLDLDDIWCQRATYPGTPLDHAIDPAQAAYILYTSGSTGVPKGVVGLHAGMLNRLRWMWQRFPYAAGEVLCHKTSLSFLDSFCEIFGPLCQGLPVVVVSQRAVLDPVELVAVLGRHRVSRLVLVPSLLRSLLDTVPDLAARLPELTLWVSSGEALTADLAARFLAALPGRRLLNLYGASEVSADVTWHLADQSDVDRGVLPLGRPIATTSVYVLDERLRPVPPGVAGEIYVGGVSLGRGYLGRPDLTAERFLPDPFAGEQGSRLYRTGDRGRHRSDGLIEYLGRRDDQIKVRGYRVEPAEVERVLAGHPMIAQAVVTAEDDVLVAFCVPQRPGDIEVEAVRAHLRDRLPAFMVPTTFIAVDALALTPSGKVDRGALRRADHTPLADLSDGAERVEPRDDAERAVAELWRETLDTPTDFGVHDNFWSVGGYSLLATRFATRVREVFSADFPLDRFFADPTIAGVVAELRTDPVAAPDLDERAALLLKVAAMSAAELDRLLAQPGNGSPR